MQSPHPMFVIAGKGLIPPPVPGTSALSIPYPAWATPGKTLVFGDHFDGSSLDTTKWQPYFPNYYNFSSQSPGGVHTNTGDASYYDPSKVTVSGSACHLKSDLQTTVSGLPYTSGMIQSYPDAGGGWQGLYGIFEARIKMDAMYHGSWPAAWMSCSNSSGSPPSLIWPPEIDYFEAKDEFTNTYLANTYRADGTEDSTTVTNASSGLSIDFSQWTLFGLQWTATGTKFYLNGTQVATSSLVLNLPQYLIFDHAAIAAHTPSWTTNQMHIDYIGVWQ